MLHHKFIWCSVFWFIFLQSAVLFLLDFFYLQCFSVLTGVIMVCMAVFIFSSFPSSVIILYLVALMSLNEQNDVVLSWGILVCHDNIDKTFSFEGTYLSWGSSSTLTPWCWWFQNSFSVSNTSAPIALARITWSSSSIQSGHQVGISEFIYFLPCGVCLYVPTKCWWCHSRIFPTFSKVSSFVTMATVVVVVAVTNHSCPICYHGNCVVVMTSSNWQLWLVHFVGTDIHTCIHTDNSCRVKLTLCTV